MHPKKPIPILLLVCTVACSLWERKIVFAGSSSTDLLEINEPFPENGWGLQIVLHRKGTKRTLYQLRGDVFLNFADVVWTNDDATVSVYTCGTPALKLAYSGNEANPTPFSATAGSVAAHIRAQYALRPETSDSDVLAWACSPEGEAAFHSRHPEATAR